MNPMQLIGMMQKTQNPMGLLNQLGQNNPQIKKVLEVMNGKSPQQLEQYVKNLAQTQGVNINQLANRLGFNLPQ